MKKDYFIVVLAHSFHGRLRRLHVSHHIVYLVLALALVGGITVVGVAASYLRMAWKVADYNALRSEFDKLRERYQTLQRETTEKNEQLATLQLFATEVSLAYGIKQRIEGPADISAEGELVPSFNESLEEYNFLKSANFSIFSRKYPRLWQTNSRPTLWPINGRLQSYFGKRSDPFTGMGAFHPGVDIPAPTGTPVRAGGDGIVARAEWMGAYGRLVVIDHGAGMSSYYGHLSRMDVIAGQEVRVGQIIGAVGSTGRTTAPHLHYEVRQGGNPVNPYIFLRSSARAGAPAQRDLPF
ncbi:MAG: M23 family metallopeptidase [Bryobacteraceae bacterium]|nr:M23 family metallopeptidase [Bryobacteraceae bacterium]